MKMVTLTDEEFEKLQDVLVMYEDSGPTGSGWQSDELIQLRESVANANQS